MNTYKIGDDVHGVSKEIHDELWRMRFEIMDLKGIERSSDGSDDCIKKFRPYRMEVSFPRGMAEVSTGDGRSVVGIYKFIDEDDPIDDFQVSAAKKIVDMLNGVE